MPSSVFESIGFTAIATLGGLTISQPFISSLVRLRANYLPRQLALPATPSSSSRGQVGPGLFTVLRRTCKQHSFSTLYAGGLILAFSQFFQLLLGLMGSADGVPRPEIPVHHLFLGVVVYGVLLSIIDLPASVLSYRAIVHPGAPDTTWASLLSPLERNHLWKLYFNKTYLVCYFALYLSYILPKIFAHVLGSTSLALAFPKAALIFSVALEGLSTGLIWWPLSLVWVRLAIQDVASKYTGLADTIEDTEAQSCAEPVIKLRPTTTDASSADLETGTSSEAQIPATGLLRPYAGVGDCFRTIIAEEGAIAFYRGWGILLTYFILLGIPAVAFQLGFISINALF